MAALLRAGVRVRGDVVLALVGGEIERHSVGRHQGRHFRGGGCGTRYLVTNGGTADMAVIGEPTFMRVVPEHVGSLAVRLTTRGLPAPLRKADQGTDAIRAMRPLLDVFDDFSAEYSRRYRYRNLTGTIHLAALEGGWPWRCNRVPVFCSAYVEARVLPDQTIQQVRREIDALVVRAQEKEPAFQPAAIAMAGLTGFEEHYPHQLSGGMQQRVNIIRTLVCDPEVLLMDEPFGQLDALTRSQLQGHLLQLWEDARRTVLFVTHDLREAIVLADRVIVMTARPGTVKSDLRVDIPRPRDVFRVHEEPTFKPIHDRLWNEVVAELAQPPGVRTGPRR